MGGDREIDPRPNGAETTSVPDPPRSDRPGALFYAGWIGAVVIVFAAMAGLVLARELWVRRQTAALDEQMRRGPRVLVTPVTHAPAVRELNLPGDIHGFL